MDKFFKGLYTAQITPLSDGKLDIPSFMNLLNRQINAKVNGVVIGGSTGEVSTLTLDEYKLLLNTSYKILNNKTQFIAGVSSNTPIKAVELAQIAEGSGADAIMCVMPFYNKAPQRGLIKYFEAIHEQTTIPIMLYTVPSRTGVDFTDDTIIELSKFDRIIGLKDSAADIERPLRLFNKLPQKFSLLSGEDSNCLAYSAHGGVGCVSVISNIIPTICKSLQDHLLNSEYTEALKLQAKLIELYRAIFVETNPIPIKFAASYLGLCNEEVRAPLVEITDNNIKNKIVKTLDSLSKDIDLL